MGDVLHERPVRADDEDALPRVPLAKGVEQPRRTVKPDGRLARAGPTLDDEWTIRFPGDQPVLVGLDRGDDVAHVRLAAALELLEQEVADGRPVERRAVQHLVGEVEQPTAVGTEASAEHHALRFDRGGGVEGPRGGRLPVHDHLLALFVVHPASADVERPLDLLEVEPPEDEATLCVFVRREPTCAPSLERERRHLLVGRGRRPSDDLPHPLEAHVGMVDVRLLGRQVWVRHHPSLPR